MNWPTKSKIDKGYGKEPPQSYLIEQRDATFSLDDFKVLPVPACHSPGVMATPASATGTGEATFIDDIGELDQWKVPDRVKLIIVEGRGDAPKQGDDSRSAWLFDAVCKPLIGKIRCFALLDREKPGRAPSGLAPAK